MNPNLVRDHAMGLAETLEHAARGLKNLVAEADDVGELAARGVAEMEEADVPQFPFWCDADECGVRYVTKNATWKLHATGIWEKFSNPKPRSYQQSCEQHICGWHTITAADAMATLDFSGGPIYVSSDQMAQWVARIDDAETCFSNWRDGGWVLNRHITVAGLLHEVRQGHRRILPPAEATAIIAPKPAADVPQGDFWCMSGRGDVWFVTDKESAHLCPDGAWDRQENDAAKVRKWCAEHHNGWHTITEADAMATLDFAGGPIYVSGTTTGGIHRIASATHANYRSGVITAWHSDHCSIGGLLHDVRTGKRRVLTAAEANAIIAPVPTLLDEARRTHRWLAQLASDTEAREFLPNITRRCGEYADSLNAAIARDKAEAGDA